MGVQGRRSREKGGGGQEMSSTLSYYASKNRASERLDNKRNEISRSSAYILDSTSSTNRSSYSSNTPQSYADSRTGRSSYRDRSTDFSARTSHGHRSSSRDIGSVRLRNREHSTDISHRKDFSQSYSNGSTSGYSRSRASRCDGEDHSEEYKKIMSSTDKYVTMAKYTTADHSDTTNMLEEERTSKAYSKIIGSAQSTEADNSRATLTDIFCNTNGFSAKTVQAIYKETLYKEEGGRPKNYGWRKDMEAYEDNLDKINEHKKAVRETTRERAGGMLTTSPRLSERPQISSHLPQLTRPVVMSLQPLITDPVLLSRTTSQRASQSEDPGGRIWKHLNRLWRRRKQPNQP